MTEQKEVKGVHLWTLNWLLIGLASALAVALLVTVNRTNIEYQTMQTATDRYVQFRLDASAVQTVSDFLTDRVRTYVVTGDRGAREDYFQEVNVTRRRERALNHVRQEAAATEEIARLEMALDYSNRLTGTEKYAMRLASAAFGEEIASLPTDLLTVNLTVHDATLSADAQAELARSMVFNEEYHTLKQGVSDNVSRCMETLLLTAQGAEADSTRRLDRLLRIQTVLILSLVAIGFLIVMATLLLAIRPLRKAVGLISEEKTLPDRGAYEMRFLARVYNRMFEQNSQKREKLSYEVAHDSLTGLYNRSAFDRRREHTDWSRCTLFLIDVDNFKTYNDSYGHDVGDRVLIRVGEVLTAHFRAEDQIFRIGGDEFSVIMDESRPAMKETVAEKIAAVNRELKTPVDGMPVLSVSVGVAFGREGITSDGIFKEADQALYRVKNGGRGGCDFN